MSEFTVLGVTELEGHACGATGCDDDPVALQVKLDPDRGLAIRWLCRRHAQKAHDAGFDLHSIPPDCGSGGEAKCGAAATHIAIVDEGDLSHPLRVAGVCPRHILR